jgi:hypothetical protein
MSGREAAELVIEQEQIGIRQLGLVEEPLQQRLIALDVRAAAFSENDQSTARTGCRPMHKRRHRPRGVQPIGVEPPREHKRQEYRAGGD